MTKQNLLITAIVGLLLINLSLVTFMAMRQPPLGRQPGGKGPKNLIIEKLAFTPEQTAQYDQLIKQHQVDIRRLNDEISQTKNKLYETLADDDQSKEAFFISRLGALQRQVETVHYAHFLALKKLCTPGQQDRFRELTRELSGYFAQSGRPPLSQQPR